jgi:hypothetical protein
LPIAINEDINIELLIPKLEENQLNNERKLEWRLKLKPGEKRIIPLKFSMEFHENLTVCGLE